MVVWLLFAACVPTPGTSPSADSGLETYVIPELNIQAPTAVWTPADAVDALAGALTGDFPSPFAVRDSLAGWFSHGDAACPGEGTYMAGPSFEGCTSAEGWYYLGVGGFSEDFGEDELGPRVILDLAADLTILAPEGARIDIGGHWIPVLREGPSWRAILNGSWIEPNHPADWFSSGISAWLDYAGTVNEAGHLVSLDGGLHLRDATLQFTTFNLGIEGCGETPTGEIGIRDPGGGMWSVDFGADCHPCGSVFFEDAPVETDACLALDGLAGRIIAASSPPPPAPPPPAPPPA